MNLANSTALITGASAGIGAEFARQLHAEGCRVILVARRAALLEALALRLNEIRPGSASVLVADLASESGLAAAVRYIEEHEIDILVNNAGRGTFGYLEEIPLEDELQMLRLNVVASTVLARAILPQLKGRRRGAILSLSSVAGFQPLPYLASYSATKAFNLFQSLALRAEVRRFGIRVLAVCPGPTDTEFGGVARVPGQVTGVVRDTPAAVVRESLRALRWNLPFIVPGWRFRVLSWGSRILPLGCTTALMGVLLRGSLPQGSPPPQG